MPILGAHMSIAGGFDQAVVRAADAGCDCVQIFVSSPRQFPLPRKGRPRAAPPVDAEAVASFQEALSRYSIRYPIAHASYLLNPASPDRSLARKSIRGIREELSRSDALGLDYLVMHPGASLNGRQTAAVRRVGRAINGAFAEADIRHTRLLLETTAGQGTNLGWQFNQLADMLAELDEPDRVGICLDTCHVFAAGYDLRSEAAYVETMAGVESAFGAARIKAFHLNDSQRELGSRVDRHENIGHGHLGNQAFRLLLTDPRFAEVPMYLETPKGTRDRDGKPWDQINLARLRRLARKSS